VLIPICTLLGDEDLRETFIPVRKQWDSRLDGGPNFYAQQIINRNHGATHISSYKIISFS